MKWEDKIKRWDEYNILKYPKKIKKRFFYETSFITEDMTEKYKEKFIQNKLLEEIEQNYEPFNKYIKESKNKYVTSFYNLSKTTLLIIPIPRKNKKFTTLKDFIDNASKKQQKEFWKKVSFLIKKMLKINKKIWVNTHGLGIHYFHLRIDTSPKYYLTKKFK